ncbi:MAG: methyltransferase domain-containing protein [Nitrosarchaeum sp.]|nr:MAG: methyltransferase domain-containing protein [Nitrosarchaeum sp.]
MKLHVGCGNVILPGWTNLDIEKLPGVDIIDDVTTLTKIPNNSCDIIYASHVLEHVGRNEFEDVIRTWNKKLKKNGTLRIAVPDFEKIITWYQKTKQIIDIVGLVSGGQKTKYDYHKMIYDKKSLTEILLKMGFQNIQEWDWRQTDHSKFDDYSQSYLPHMEKDKGLLMSLNLEAIKINEPPSEQMKLGKSPWRS